MMLDLPQQLGPTTPTNCRGNTILVGSAMDLNKAHFDFDHHIAWLTNLKSSYDLTVESIGMKFLNEWKKNDFEIFHQNKKYFTITAVQVIISNREVSSWTQPIIESAQEGIIGFILKEINGVYHFLVQAKLESGNFDILELAPTVQCLTGNYRKGSNEYEVPFLDLFLTAKPEQIIHKSLQSEEGGRFYREQNLNIIIKVGEDFSSDKIPENFTWMTLAQLMEFIKFNNYLNIQARSLLSCISFGNTNLHSNLNDKKN
jgi:oxidase EvaA